MKSALPCMQCIGKITNNFFANLFKRYGRAELAYYNLITWKKNFTPDSRDMLYHRLKHSGAYNYHQNRT